MTYGKGEFYLCGFSVGYSYLKTNDEFWLRFTGRIFEKAKITKNEYSDGEKIYEKTLVCDGKEIIFLLNNTAESKTFDIKGNILRCGADMKRDGKKFILPEKSIGYVIKNNKHKEDAKQ